MSSSVFSKGCFGFLKKSIPRVPCVLLEILSDREPHVVWIQTEPSVYYKLDVIFLTTKIRGSDLHPGLFLPAEVWVVNKFNSEHEV